jgi:hypothetical protein
MLTRIIVMRHELSISYTYFSVCSDLPLIKNYAKIFIVIPIILHIYLSLQGWTSGLTETAVPHRQ